MNFSWNSSQKVFYKYYQNNFYFYSIIARDLSVSLINEKSVIERFSIIGNDNKKPSSEFSKKPLSKNWAGKVALDYKNNLELPVIDVAKRYFIAKSAV